MVEMALRRKNVELQRALDAAIAERDEWKERAEQIYFYHVDFCERVRDGGFVQLPPPDLRIVTNSQTD